MYVLNNFDITVFLRDYWQQKPLLVKGGFSQFIDPLDEHELAGLALESEIDSRLISFNQNRWQVDHGPFDDINTLCVGAWSLLVQAVDQHVPEADELMRTFSFIPHWRMTDLMVSFSNAQAGVGPHIDQYDVFIIQGKGTRHWQVGLPADYESFQPHCDLKQIKGFQPIIDAILEPGDFIYIPPHHPHNGIALEDCMNYSVGFRAPSTQELLSSFSDYAIDKQLFTQRYSDPNLRPRHFAGEIKQHEIGHFKQIMSKALNSPNFEQWIAHFLSETSHLKTSDESEEDDYSVNEIEQLLQSGAVFYRELGVKVVFTERQVSETQDFIFFIAGKQFSCPPSAIDFVLNFLNQPTFSKNEQQLPKNSLFFTQIMTKLVNSGFWYPE